MDNPSYCKFLINSQCQLFTLSIDKKFNQWSLFSIWSLINYLCYTSNLLINDIPSYICQIDQGGSFVYIWGKVPLLINDQSPYTFKTDYRSMYDLKLSFLINDQFKEISFFINDLFHVYIWNRLASIIDHHKENSSILSVHLV